MTKYKNNKKIHKYQGKPQIQNQEHEEDYKNTLKYYCR